MIHFCHIRNDFLPQGTAAFELPTKSILHRMVADDAFGVMLPFGLTKLHPQEPFVKKVGREQAKLKMQHVAFTITRIVPNFSGAIYVFEASVMLGLNEVIVRMGVSTKADKDDLRVKYMEIVHRADSL